MSRVLAVFLHDSHAGSLLQDDSGRLSFTYRPEYVQQQKPSLSVTLPLQTAPFGDRITRPFFSGLLPDAAARQRLANILGVSVKNPFTLLEAVGGECAGAVVLCPPGMSIPPENEDDFEILDDAGLQRIFVDLQTNPLLARGSRMRLSLAGAQDKLAVRKVGDRLHLMRGGAATTHILKPMIAGVSDSVANEFFCLQLAARVGLPVPAVEIRVAGNLPFLLIERYDRKAQIQAQSQQILRLHQEDFCQALSFVPELKYESEGGPGVRQCLDLIQTASRQPEIDRQSWIERLFFSVMLGNMDAHGKNYALLYPSPTEAEARPCLAPVYDVLSTEIYPGLSDRLAMKIGKKKQADDLYLRHWETLVPDTQLAKVNLHQWLEPMAIALQTHAPQLVAELSSLGIRSPIFEQILGMIRKRSQHILQQL